MKVLFLCRYYAPHIGGVEKHVAKISQILSQKHEVIIITEQHDPHLPQHELIDNIPVYRIPVLEAGESAKKWVIWKWMWDNRQILNSADILHAHDVYFWLMPYKFFHHLKKTYVTFHGWEAQYPIPRKNIIVRKISELMANGNICVGDFIVKWYGTRPSVVTYGAA